MADELYWDPIDTHLRDDPYPLWKRLHDEAPVYRNERHDFWALSRYADVEAAHKDHATFSSAHATSIDRMTVEPNVDTGMFINLDPPMHTAYRSLVSRAFTPRKIGGLEDDVRRIAADLLDRHVGGNGFDYVQDFGAILPPTVISSLLGVPAADQEWLRHQVDLIFHVEPDVGMDNPTSHQAGAEVFLYCLAQVEERRTAPRDDLFTTLAQAELARPEIAGEFGVMLFAAGSETVARLLGWFGSILAELPDQRAALREDPSLVPGAVEELLRYEAPSPVQARWTARPVEIHGQTIPIDSKVVLITGAAGRDERAYPDPDRFDVRRDLDRHVSLGLGIHFCLGAALARMEGRIGIEETLARFPEWEVDRDGARLLYTSTVRGYDRLPVRGVTAPGFSAQGTRLNRRGLETRAQILDVAVRLLARGGTDVASASLVAREAGVTWGTIQHQFGDTDGVWAAVVGHVAEQWADTFVAGVTGGPTLEHRVRAIVDTMWATLDDETVRAVTNLRQLLPHDADALTAQFPATAAALLRWDAAWNRSWDDIFRGLVRSQVKLRRVRSLLPGAVLGLHAEARRTTFVDVDEGRRGLVDAIVCYLQPRPGRASSVG